MNLFLLKRYPPKSTTTTGDRSERPRREREVIIVSGENALGVPPHALGPLLNPALTVMNSGEVSHFKCM